MQVQTVHSEGGKQQSSDKLDLVGPVSGVHSYFLYLEKTGSSPVSFASDKALDLSECDDEARACQGNAASCQLHCPAWQNSSGKGTQISSDQWQVFFWEEDFEMNEPGGLRYRRLQDCLWTLRW